jgi:hypothetical protein
MVSFLLKTHIRIQGDSLVIMNLTKIVMQPTLHLDRLCGFKKYVNFTQHSQHSQYYICQT